ncbi:MAG: site-specific integrase [Candidatus Niameybacter stercoravium]|nr:site-specific integrase [Candidatus Niameybacter stercoravium]
MDKKDLKTKNSKRIIPISNALKPLLLNHHQHSSSEYVFPSSTGSHMTPENVRRIQISLCKKANIPYKNFHALRHTFATRLIESGVDIKTVSLLLGHADINITLNTYVHSTDDTKHNAANALNYLL